jgi:hypothetical protein
MKSSLFAWLFAFFTPVFPLMIIVGMFIVFDTYMGRKAVSVMAKSKGENPRKYLKSSITRAGLFRKFFLYNSVLLSVYLIDLFVLGEFVEQHLPIDHLITRGGMVVLCWVEYDSIDEKYYKINGITLTCVIKDKVNKFKGLLQAIFKFTEKKKL